jgi:hypothetical protein
LKRRGIALAALLAVTGAIHLTLRLDSVVAGAPRKTENSLRIGLAVSGNTDIDTFAQDALSLDRVLVFLGRSPVFAYDDSLYSVIGDGALLATVQPNGQYDFVFLDDVDATPLEADRALEGAIAEGTWMAGRG